MNEIEKRGLLWTATQWRKTAQTLIRKWGPDGTYEVRNEVHASQKNGDERAARTFDLCAEQLEGLCE